MKVTFMIFFANLNIFSTTPNEKQESNLKVVFKVFVSII